MQNTWDFGNLVCLYFLGGYFTWISVDLFFFCGNMLFALSLILTCIVISGCRFMRPDFPIIFAGALPLKEGLVMNNKL